MNNKIFIFLISLIRMHRREHSPSTRKHRSEMPQKKKEKTNKETNFKKLTVLYGKQGHCQAP